MKEEEHKTNINNISQLSSISKKLKQFKFKKQRFRYFNKRRKNPKHQPILKNKKLLDPHIRNKTIDSFNSLRFLFNMRREFDSPDLPRMFNDLSSGSSNKNDRKTRLHNLWLWGAFAQIQNKNESHKSNNKHELPLHRL